MIEGVVEPKVAATEATEQNVAGTQVVVDQKVAATEVVEQKVPAKRGRKPKQTLLNEYYSSINVKHNVTDKTDKSEEKESSNTSTTKSSRYGRVIKPKSLEIESNSKLKFKPLKVETPSDEPKGEISQKHSKQSSLRNSSRKSSLPKEPLANDSLPKEQLPKEDGQTPPIATSQMDTSQTNTSHNETPLDISLNESEVKTSIMAPPKKRGREKKCDFTDLPPMEIIHEIPPPVEVSTEIIVPRRRSKKQSFTLLEPEIMQEINALPEQTPLTVDTPKRRGRKVKAKIENLNSTVNIEVEQQNDAIIEPSPEIPSKRRRERQSKTLNQNVEIGESSILAQPEEVPEVQPKTPKPRQRKKKVTDDSVDVTLYKCGNCQQDIPPKKWKAHEATHYGVTWRVGIDIDIDVEDQSTMCRLMIKHMKINKLQYLKCDKCGEKKKSALGYISHIEVCGLTEEEKLSMKEECEFCKKLYRKVSLPIHQQSFCPVRRLELAQQQADETVKSVCEMDESEQCIEATYSESGRPKRIIKKVKKPTMRPVDDFIKFGSKITGGKFKNWTNQLREEKMIKCSNENCTFIATDITAIQTHFRQCKETLHHCKLCPQAEQSRTEMVKHIEIVHADALKIVESEEELDDKDNKDDDADFQMTDGQESDSDDEYCEDVSIDELGNKSSKRKFKASKRKAVIPLKRIMEEDSPAYWDMLSALYTRLLNIRPGYHRKSYEWTTDFVEQNYNLDALVIKQFLRNNPEHVRMPQREVNKLLGLLHSKSPKFLCQKQTAYNLTKSELIDASWIQLDLFHSLKTTHLNAESAVLFCGGKIITADWIPFPKDYSGNQVLVVCSQSEGTQPITRTNCVKIEKSKNLIQLWSVSSKSNGTIDQTQFMYGIAYEDGPICAMCICPSDAYVAKSRLAVMALPDTVGHVNIIELPESVSKAKSNAPPIIKLKPVIKLQLCLKPGEVSSQTITQMVWSRTKGHKVLIAGYNTGLIAVWNFAHLNSSYLCHKSADGTPVLLPQQTFIGALSHVSQLDAHTDVDGSVRWVLVGGIDRRIRFYDLKDPQLIPFTSQIFKSRIISGTWPLHWPIYLTMIDAAFSRQNGGLYIKPVLYTNNLPRNSNLAIDAEPSNLAFSDWLNTGIFGNDVGDLFMINFQQLLLHDRYDESSEQKVLSSTDVFVNEEENGDEPHVRVLFNDFDDTILTPKMAARVPSVERHPHARITRIAINPNESHQKLIAIGYELGFSRIHFIP